MVTDKDKCVLGTTVSKAIKAHVPDMTAFTPHDLRRTVATHMKALKVPEPDIGVLLNHSLQGVTAIYARGVDIEKLRKILNKWHRHLNTILTGQEKKEKVVSIR